MADKGDDPRIVATAFVDAVAAETIVGRRRQMREETGNVTGHAIGHGPEKTSGTKSSLLDRLLTVIHNVEAEGVSPRA